MAKIERFEDIKAWQLARELVKKVYRSTIEDQRVRFGANYMLQWISGIL